MGSAVVVQADPVANDKRGALNAFEPMSICVLFFVCSDELFCHTVCWMKCGVNKSVLRNSFETKLLRFTV